MTKRKRIVPNVVRGGVAIPLGANYFLMKGKTHEQGGIDIGKDLEVENGELMKIDKNNMTIVSNAPIINGISPAEYALGGLKDGTFVDRFKQGFKYQEKYKDINGLKDDGTKAKFGDKIKNIYNEFIKWINTDSEIDETKKGGYSKNTEQKRLYKSIKYDPTSRFYVDATFNPMASGEEQSYYREYLGLNSDVPKMNSNSKTEWDDEVEKEKINNGELPSDFYGTTKRMDLNIQALADTLNVGNIYRNYDKYKKQHPELPSKKEIKTIYEQGKKVLNNPNKWQQIDGDYGAAIKENPEKYTYEINPLGMLGNFGMKWVPDENKIYIHDTYDFPKHLIGRGRPMYNRPKEMKIRGSISFNPEQGSYLLRDNMNNFYNYPEPITINRNELKLGGKTQMKRIKRNVPSTGERKKADLGLATSKPVRDLYKKVFGKELELVPSWAKSEVNPFALEQRPVRIGTPIMKDELESVNINLPQGVSYSTKPAGFERKIEALPQGLNINTPTLSTTEDYGRIKIPGIDTVLVPEPTFNQKAKLAIGKTKNFINNNIDVLGDLTNAGVGIGMAIASNRANNKMLESLEELPDITKSIQLSPTKLKTSYNIHPQLAKARKIANRLNRFVDRNTSSSQTVISRRRQNELDYLENFNTLYGQKENVETQLINQDRMLQHQTDQYNNQLANQDIARQDQRVAENTQLRNTIREQKSENQVALYDNISNIINNIITNNQSRRANNRNLRVMAKAYPSINEDYLKEILGNLIK